MNIRELHEITIAGAGFNDLEMQDEFIKRRNEEGDPSRQETFEANLRRLIEKNRRFLKKIDFYQSDITDLPLFLTQLRECEAPEEFNLRKGDVNDANITENDDCAALEGFFAEDRKLKSLNFEGISFDKTTSDKKYPLEIFTAFFASHSAIKSIKLTDLNRCCDDLSDAKIEDDISDRAQTLANIKEMEYIGRDLSEAFALLNQRIKGMVHKLKK